MATYTNIYPAFKGNQYLALTYKAFSALILLLTVLFSGTALAQTPPPATVEESNLTCDISKRNPCTSKDLSIVSVFIDAENCETCESGDDVEYDLYMTIHNGTKSERTSFALYGTLSEGASINGVEGKIFVCVGPITVKSDQNLGAGLGNQTFYVGKIKFECGQELSLTDNFLAWTDASGTTSARCSTFLAADECSDIAPKCGTDDNITIEGPVTTPTLDKVDPTCTLATGTVTVTSNTTGLLFSLNGGDFEEYPSGGWSGLNSGQHCVRARRTSGECISEPACITILGQPANPDRPVVTLQEATICGTVTTPTVTVTCPIAGTYKLNQPNEAQKTFTFTGSNGPVAFTVKPGIGFSITVTNTAGCTSDATTCDNYTTNNCPETVRQPTSKVQEQTIKLVPQNETKVLAAPNPFNDRIRFTLESGVSGQGSLELYNLLGQKVKTVYQGYVKKGEIQSVEYTVPRTERSNLIYVFRVGEERVTGKLVSVKQ